MSAPDIARIRELAEAATPGPWHFYELQRNSIGMGYIRTSHDTLEIAHHGDMGRDEAENRANAELIVAAINALPALCDAADRCAEAEREVDRLRRMNVERQDGLRIAARKLRASEAQADRLAEGLKDTVDCANAICGADPYDERSDEAFNMFNEARRQARSLLSEHAAAKEGRK